MDIYFKYGFRIDKREMYLPPPLTLNFGARRISRLPPPRQNGQSQKWFCFVPPVCSLPQVKLTPCRGDPDTKHGDLSLSVFLVFFTIKFFPLCVPPPSTSLFAFIQSFLSFPFHRLPPFPPPTLLLFPPLLKPCVWLFHPLRLFRPGAP